MAVLIYDFYDREDLTTPIGSLDDSQLIEMQIRAAFLELGAGQLTVSSHLAAASSNLLQRGRIVKVRAPVIGSDPVWGFVLRDLSIQLVSHQEQGGERITFTGPGLLGLLADARLPTLPAVSDQPFRGSYDVPYYWTWEGEPYGAIFARAMEEGQSEDGTPLAGISFDFTRTHDSNGVAWVAIAETFQTSIGTDLLTLARQMAAAGDFYLVYDYTTDTISAYQSYGTDQSGSVTVEKGVNLLTELTRKSKAQPFTHLIQRDADGNYSTEVIPAFSGIGRYGYAEARQTNDDDMLNRIAQQTLISSADESEEYEVELTPTDYLPWVDFIPGDSIGIDTGSGEHDLNESMIVMAVRLVVDQASRDDDADRQKRSLHVVAELAYRATQNWGGDPTSSNAPAPVSPPQLCTPATDAVQGSNILCSVVQQAEPSSNLKTSGTGAGNYPFHAARCDEDASRWGTNGFPVSNQYWAVDLLTAYQVGSWRIFQWLTAGNAASSVNIYATNDAAKWAAVTGTGYNFGAAGWDLIATVATVPGDNSGTFDPVTYRYWAFDAAAGGANGWDVFEFELAQYSGFRPNQGLPELVGNYPCAPHGDHRHDIHRDAAPTTAENAAAGYLHEGLIWAQLDSLVTPTAIVAVWMLVDAAAGTWLPWPGGSGGSAETWEQVVSDLAADLVHRWNFEEASGNFNDLIGSYDLAASGSITYQVASPVGLAAQFASGARGTATGMGSLPVGDAARTTICIFRTTGTVTTNAAIYGYGTTSSTRQWWAQKVNDATTYSDSLAVWADDNIQAGRGSSDGQWHMFAATHDSERTLKLYIDGMEWARRLAGDLNTGSGNAMKAPYDNIAAAIADLMVFDRVLSKAELDRLYAAFSRAT